MKLNAFKRLSIFAAVLANTNYVKVEHDTVRYNHKLHIKGTEERVNFLCSKYDLYIHTQSFNDFVLMSYSNWASDEIMNRVNEFLNIVQTKVMSTPINETQQ